MFTVAGNILAVVAAAIICGSLFVTETADQKN